MVVFKNKQVYLSLSLGYINSSMIEINLLMDIFGAIFLSTVVIISFAVFSFSFRYIGHYKFFSRFHILLFIFVTSIILLIISSNILFTLIGWDGLGISSYLLVIYYGRVKSYNAGILTVLSNRFGDVLILLRIGLILHIGSWNIKFYREILCLNSVFSIFLVVGAFTKRAQIPFRAWLPAAIAAPTPVSSLVHSSTLVTAGVYLLFRHLNELIRFSQLNFILIVGVATIIMARLSALNEKDIKKIVALSTLRQLGLMATRLGLNWVFIRFFHLIIHAFFKAMIFIRVGNLIHFRQFYQAIKNRGRELFSSPFNRSTLVLARVSLTGAPFAAAFFSKEPIIEWSVHSGSYSGLFFSILVSVFITIIYRARLIKVVLINYRGIKPNLNLYEGDTLLRKGIMILYLPSFLRGRILSALMIITPRRFFYSRSIKTIIFSSFLLFFFIFTKRRYNLNIFGITYFYSMWSLSLFSRSFITWNQKKLSWNINRLTFGYNLKFLGVMINIFSLLRRALFRTSFVFRVLVSIPLFIFLFSQI